MGEDALKGILVDSDILIDVARGRDAALLARLTQLGGGNAVIACMPVTVAELWHGARPPEFKALDALFHALTCVPIDSDIGRLAGDYMRQFAKSPRVELGDALIAATVSIHNLTLWTRNRKHYPMKECSFF